MDLIDHMRNLGIEEIFSTSGNFTPMFGDSMPDVYVR